MFFQAKGFLPDKCQEGRSARAALYAFPFVRPHGRGRQVGREWTPRLAEQDGLCQPLVLHDHRRGQSGYQGPCLRNRIRRLPP